VPSVSELCATAPGAGPGGVGRLLSTTSRRMTSTTAVTAASGGNSFRVMTETGVAAR
jgi:hypothetical protein